MDASNYSANLSTGTKVRLAGPVQHARQGHTCTIIRTLPNPSNRPENQWYDVRFEDGTFARFLEKYLVPLEADGENRAA